jgi:hypothetical protein
MKPLFLLSFFFTMHFSLMAQTSPIRGRDGRKHNLVISNAGYTTPTIPAGRLAGVQVTGSEGSPNAQVLIRVRGGGSITQDNSPLYVVDGIQVDFTYNLKQDFGY